LPISILQRDVAKSFRDIAHDGTNRPDTNIVKLRPRRRRRLALTIQLAFNLLRLKITASSTTPIRAQRISEIDGIERIERIQIVRIDGPERILTQPLPAD
jgi:hypothetical protein